MQIQPVRMFYHVVYKQAIQVCSIQFALLFIKLFNDANIWPQSEGILSATEVCKMSEASGWRSSQLEMGGTRASVSLPTMQL